VRFVDTNVLLYSISTDEREAEKAEAARAILAEGDLGLSVQVLQEFYVQATRAGREDALDHELALGLIESFLRFRILETSAELVLAAARTQQRFQISYWDAAIIEAARALDCGLVLSEDLSDGQDYGGVTVANPFTAG
jgi:predicted nucleic acid-binding protein